MPYGPSSTAAAAGGAAGTLAATGFSLASWVLAAVTLVLLGIAMVQLVKRGPAVRP